MDLYCTSCGEPWDNDTFHDVAEETDSTYEKVMREFRVKGCAVIPGQSCVPTPATNTDRTFGLRPQDASAALFDMLGDDTDGIAAMMEDMGF